MTTIISTNKPKSKGKIANLIRRATGNPISTAMGLGFALFGVGVSATVIEIINASIHDIPIAQLTSDPKVALLMGGTAIVGVLVLTGAPLWINSSKNDTK